MSFLFPTDVVNKTSSLCPSVQFSVLCLQLSEVNTSPAARGIGKQGRQTFVKGPFYIISKPLTYVVFRLF